MKIIMNPPYDGSLHLKILDKVIEAAPSSEIVNLSPIRWLQDPLAERKQGTDFKRFENIRKHISNIEEIDGKEASELFGAAFYSSLGIYYIDGKEHKAFSYSKNPLLEKILDFDCQRFTYDEPEDKLYKMTLPATHGHLGMADWAEITSKDFEVAKKVKGESTTNAYVKVAFDTEAELKSFYDSLFTKFYKWLVSSIKTTAATAQYIKFVPYLGDYTHPWTDEMLYEYFGLTEDEIKEIEKCAL